MAEVRKSEALGVDALQDMGLRWEVAHVLRKGGQYGPIRCWRVWIDEHRKPAEALQIGQRIGIAGGEEAVWGSWIGDAGADPAWGQLKDDEGRPLVARVSDRLAVVASPAEQACEDLRRWRVRYKYVGEVGEIWDTIDGFLGRKEGELASSDKGENGPHG